MLRPDIGTDAKLHRGGSVMKGVLAFQGLVTLSMSLIEALTDKFTGYVNENCLK